MKCRVCKTEMLVDRAVEKQAESVVEIHYKCPNTQCSQWGYKDVTPMTETPKVEEETPEEKVEETEENTEEEI